MRSQLLLLLVVGVGFGLRVYALGHQELRGDEAFTWNYIQNDPLEIVATIVREGDPQPPLHYWLQWAWGKFTGYGEFAMRAWSALLSLLLVPLMFQLGRRLLGFGAGLWAAGLMAVQPQQIWLAQDVRNMYQLALTCLIPATLLLTRLAQPTAPALPAGRTLAAYVLLGALAMYSHYYSLLFLIAHGAYGLGAAISRPANRGPLLTWLFGGFVIALLVAPWAAVILPVYARGQLADPGNLSFTDYAWRSFGDLLAGPALPDTVKLIFSLALGVAMVLPLLVAPTSRLYPGPARLFLAAGMAVPFVGIFAVTATRSTFNTFYFVFAAPAALLLIARAMQILSSLSRLAGGLVALLLAVGYGAGLSNHYFDPAYSKTRGMRELAESLAQRGQPGQVYLANTPDPAQVYYIRPTGLEFHLQPGAIPFDPAQTEAELTRLLLEPVWFVPARTAQDPDGYVEAKLAEMAILAEETRHGKMRLLHFLPASHAQPLNARFAVGVRLIGFYLTPGRVSLVWTTDHPVSEAYTVFVHALAADGYRITGHDAPPRVPTTDWRPGRLVVDVHEFDLPTGQPITLVAGMYLPATGHRLPLESDSYGEQDAAAVVSIP